MCKHAGALDCDDDDVCTTDTCDALDGCVNTPGALDCDDDDVCTTDTCDALDGCVNTPGAWTVTTTMCTTDTCDALDGCVNTPGALDCDDDDVCTTDTCDALDGCVNTPGALDCDDDDICTDDNCDAIEGCVHVDNGQCEPWCGLTIGYWANNVKKYNAETTKGRQVCDAFFTDVTPSEVCEAVTPGQCSSCTTWTYIYNRLAKPGGLEKNTIAQMTGMYLTGQAEGEFGDFVINTDLYEPLNAPCTDEPDSIDPPTCVYPACKAKLEEACGGTICDVGELWDIIECCRSINCSIVSHMY